MSNSEASFSIQSQNRIDIKLNIVLKFKIIAICKLVNFLTFEFDKNLFDIL